MAVVGQRLVKYHHGCLLTDRTIDPVNEPDSPDLRIGDAEREDAFTALGKHANAGRLDKQRPD